MNNREVMAALCNEKKITREGWAHNKYIQIIDDCLFDEVGDKFDFSDVFDSSNSNFWKIYIEPIEYGYIADNRLSLALISVEKQIAELSSDLNRIYRYVICPSRRVGTPLKKSDKP